MSSSESLSLQCAILPPLTPRGGYSRQNAIRLLRKTLFSCVTSLFSKTRVFRNVSKNIVFRASCDIALTARPSRPHSWWYGHTKTLYTGGKAHKKHTLSSAVLWLLVFQRENSPNFPCIAWVRLQQPQEQRYPVLQVHDGSFRFSVVHRTLTGITGSLTCVRDRSYACVYTRGVGHTDRQRVSTTFLTRKKTAHKCFLCS